MIELILMCFREKLTCLEIIGVIVSSLGVLTLFIDENSESDNDIARDFSGSKIIIQHNLLILYISKIVPRWERFVFGDLLAFFGAIAATAFSLMNKKAKNHYPIYGGISFMAMIAAIFTAIISIIFEGSNFSFDPIIGIFGLFTSQ